MHDDTGDEFEKFIEWEADLKTLVMLFYMNGWVWDMGGVLRAPARQEIAGKARAMIEALEEHGGGVYLTGGRLKVFKDPEFPESYEIYVHVGHASPRIPEESN
jgi:hypothetical protein